MACAHVAPTIGIRHCFWPLAETISNLVLISAPKMGAASTSVSLSSEPHKSAYRNVAFCGWAILESSGQKYGRPNYTLPAILSTDYS